MAKALNERVIGQEHLTQAVARLIQLRCAKPVPGKPLATLLFGGSRGTGKTELALAMAEYLYQDEKTVCRFDCVELRTPESAMRLVGAPPGFIGSKRGGELTRAVFDNPKRILLFEEMERAGGELADLLLQIMEGARLCEVSSGKMADFSQAILILTTNLSAGTLTELQMKIQDPQALFWAIRDELVATGRFRLDLANRFDAILVFRPLRAQAIAQITALKIRNMAKAYGMELMSVDPAIVLRLVESTERFGHVGIRELEVAIAEMLGDHFLQASEFGVKKISLEVESDGVIALSEVE